MIEVLPAPDHVVALRLAETLREADCDRVITEVEARLKRMSAWESTST